MIPAARVLRVWNDLRKCRDEMIDFNKTYTDSIFTSLFKNMISRIDNFHMQGITSSMLTTKAPDLIDILKDTWSQERSLERDSVRERLEILSKEQFEQLDIVLNEIEKGKNFTITFQD